MVVCNCERTACVYMVPEATLDDVPAPYPNALVRKLTVKPVVLIAGSPEAVVTGVEPAEITAPVMARPVAGALLSIRTVSADRLFQAPANFSIWILVIEFSLLVELIGLAW